jgi:hypothetical protein
MSGMNFGSIDLSPNQQTGSTQCTTTSWISTTSLACTLQAGTGESAVITAGVATTLTGTLASSFTYDGARDAFAMHVLAFVMNVAS